MTIFVTGATGYLGSYIANDLLRNHPDRLALLVRAKSEEEAKQRLWQSLQLHMDFETFCRFLTERIEIYRGELTEPGLGLSSSARQSLVRSIDSIIHCAASLNRKSEKSCLNVNLRGTLHMIRLAREANENRPLRRFSDISTVAVAGNRQDETVLEERMIDWSRSDYDPYARTKKFCEYMLAELLPDIPHTVFRPSIILGDSRFPQTTQFDMVRAFAFLAKLPVLPFSGTYRADIVPADFVSRAVVTIHQKEKPKHDSYNLSSGTYSLTYREIVRTLREAGTGGRGIFAPWLETPFSGTVSALAATPRALGISPLATLLKVFLPYLTFNTVFDNRRVIEELGEKPASFRSYAAGLYRFATEGKFTYPYKPYPVETGIERKVVNV
ncbi:MAG: SDR family oxidoreductase [Pseudomonadota bacterium]